MATKVPVAWIEVTEDNRTWVIRPSDVEKITWYREITSDADETPAVTVNLDRRGEAGALNLTLTLEQAAALHRALVTGPTLTMSIGAGDPTYADTFTSARPAEPASAMLPDGSDTIAATGWARLQP
jgi:hypothetical protein